MFGQPREGQPRESSKTLGQPREIFSTPGMQSIHFQIIVSQCQPAAGAAPRYFLVIVDYSVQKSDRIERDLQFSFGGNPGKGNLGKFEIARGNPGNSQLSRGLTPGKRYYAVSSSITMIVWGLISGILWIPHQCHVAAQIYARK